LPGARLCSKRTLSMLHVFEEFNTRLMAVGQMTDELRAEAS
jgi:hypothetical protein